MVVISIKGNEHLEYQFWMRPNDRWYMIKIEYYDKENLEEILKWCVKQFGIRDLFHTWHRKIVDEPWGWLRGEIDYHKFYFIDEKDATLFQLTWV